MSNKVFTETGITTDITSVHQKLMQSIRQKNFKLKPIPATPLTPRRRLIKADIRLSFDYEEQSSPYFIESVAKTPTLASSRNSSTHTNVSNKKRFRNSFKRRGTSLRKSILGSEPKFSSSSVVSRLYSSVKKPQTNQYKSMAELLREFETQTRDCDRSRSVNRKGGAQRSRSSSVSSLTRPKSQKLHSIDRHRPTPRQTEDIIASQKKKHAFKAIPIRKKLFDANFASGIPRVKTTKAPTKAVPMHFQTEIRNELRKHIHNDDKPEVENKFKFKANPMPAFSAVNMQSKLEKKVTAIKPFSFDDKIQDLVAKKRIHSEDIQQNARKDNIMQ